MAIAVTDATAYPTGFEFTLAIRQRRTGGDELTFDPFALDDPFLWRHRQRRAGETELPPELFRFGVEFADGSKATNVGEDPFGAPDAEPRPPVLIEHGGGGGSGHWDMSFWVWPLPPTGPFAFVCEWPAKGVPLTREEIDAALILGAAARAEQLWDDSGGTGSGTWTSLGFSS